MKYFIPVLTLISLAYTATAPAVMIVESVTTTPALASGNIMNDGSVYDLASVTIGGTTYSNLEGSTATVVDGSFTYYVKDSTVPASNSAAVSGLNISSGVANISLGTGSVAFQFSQTLDNYDQFVFMELTGNDATTLTLIDSNGNSVGSTPYTLPGSSYSGSYGVVANPQSDWLRVGSASTVPSSNGVAAVAFKLSDFTGVGDLSSATGFRLAGDNRIDPVGMVAVVIPEPNSAALILGGLSLLLFRRLRRSA